MSNTPSSLTSLEQIRFDKVNTLTQAGIVCFPTRFERSEIDAVRDSVAGLLPSTISTIGDSETHTQAIAGRIM